MVGKKWLLGMLCIVFLFTNNFSYYVSKVNADDTFNIAQKKSEQIKLKSKQNSLENTLKETQKKVSDKRQQYDIINNQILETKKKKSDLNKNIVILKEKIAKVKKDILIREKEIQENIEKLKQRLVAIYKAGEVHLIDLVLNAKTFEEFIDKAEVVSKISEHDNKLINSLKADITSLENMKQSLLAEEATLEAKMTLLTSTESQLAELFAQNEAVLKQLEGEQALLKAEIDESDAEYRRIQKEIDRYLAEEAERKRREEALRRQNGNSSIEKLSTKSTGKWLWPVPKCKTLSSKYNEKRGKIYHKGIDIAGLRVYGSDVVAVDDGTVITSFSGCNHDYGKLRSCGCGGGYGNYVIISHGDGKVSIYGHLSKVNVNKGQKVKKGDKLGEVGSTGYSTGPHLHFQTKNNGVDYNPMEEY